jgi:hypothetical protein
MDSTLLAVVVGGLVSAIPTIVSGVFSRLKEKDQNKVRLEEKRELEIKAADDKKSASYSIIIENLHNIAAIENKYPRTIDDEKLAQEFATRVNASMSNVIYDHKYLANNNEFMQSYRLFSSNPIYGAEDLLKEVLSSLDTDEMNGAAKKPENNGAARLFTYQMDANYLKMEFIKGRILSREYSLEFDLLELSPSQRELLVSQHMDIHVNNQNRSYLLLISDGSGGLNSWAAKTDPIVSSPTEIFAIWEADNRTVRLQEGDSQVGDTIPSNTS